MASPPQTPPGRSSEEYTASDHARFFVHELPPFLQKLQLISRGASGWVFKVNDKIALKYARKDNPRAAYKENCAYDLLAHDAPAAITQSFSRSLSYNFLPLMRTSLEDYIRSNQDRGNPQSKSIKVLRFTPMPKVTQWAMELSDALAWLESFQYVHGDLRPANIMLDFDGHLKLIDFDRLTVLGQKNLGAPAPWARALTEEESMELGGQTYAPHSATTEQLAFGSILFNITRGYYLYEKVSTDDREMMFTTNFFPPLNHRQGEDGQLDDVITRCWFGKFENLSDLADEMAGYAAAYGMPLAIRMD